MTHNTNIPFDAEKRAFQCINVFLFLGHASGGDYATKLRAN